MFDIERTDDQKEEPEAESNFSSVEVESSTVDSEIIFVSTKDEIAADAA